MNYIEWKQKHLELLIKKIGNHEYSKNYTPAYLYELANELLGRKELIKHLGYWERTNPAQTVNECFELWLTDYFEEENNG